MLQPHQGVHISDLPRGLKAYIRNNPLQYMDYLDELKAQAEYLKSVGRGVREEQHGAQGRTKKHVVGEGECCSDECELEC